MAAFVQFAAQFFTVNFPVNLVMAEPVGGKDLLVLFVAPDIGISSPPAGPNFIITDSSGNTHWTYVPNGQVLTGDAGVVEQYYCWDVAAAGPGDLTITVNPTPAAEAAGITDAAVIIGEFSGVQSTSDPLDVYAGANDLFDTHLSTATITPSADGVAVCTYYDGSQGQSGGAGYTVFALDNTQNLGLGQYMPAVSGVGLVGSGTGNGGNYTAVLVAVFKNASSSSPSSIFFAMP